MQDKLEQEVIETVSGSDTFDPTLMDLIHACDAQLFNNLKELQVVVTIDDSEIALISKDELDVDQRIAIYTDVSNFLKKLMVDFFTEELGIDMNVIDMVFGSTNGMTMH